MSEPKVIQIGNDPNPYCLCGYGDPAYEGFCPVPNCYYHTEVEGDLLKLHGDLLDHLLGHGMGAEAGKWNWRVGDGQPWHRLPRGKVVAHRRVGGAGL